MENPELESLWTVIEDTKTKLREMRDKMLGKFQLLETKSGIEANLAKTIQFFDISNSPEYIKLKEKIEALEAREKLMDASEQKMTEIYNALIKYEAILSNLPTDISDFKTQFPSLTPYIPDPLPKLNLAVEIKTIKDAVLKCAEKEQLKTDKKLAIIEMQELLGKENIQISQEVINHQKSNQKTFEQQLMDINTQIVACDNAQKTHAGLLTTLQSQFEEWLTLDNTAITNFNSGLNSVSAKYEAADKDAWLINVLTFETKQAWDTYTPQNEKATQRFTRPNEDDIKSILSKICKERKIPNDQLAEFLLQCLEKNDPPLQSDLESVKWLFGNKSEVITDFLKLRLKEYSEKGEHQIYYHNKNISKEGLSFTERCGALLEILLEKGDEPLLLDQPEVNLGSSYITKKLITKLLTKKFQRQIIIVSHNPNTVVLADSDLVLTFNKLENNEEIDVVAGGIETDGIKELICEIMEGGTDAFDLRAKMYKKN